MNKPELRVEWEKLISDYMASRQSAAMGRGLSHTK
jgi:hypothetical protein